MVNNLQKFDFSNREHFLFLNYLLRLHHNKFFNDSVKSYNQLIEWLFYSQQNANPIFIYYLDNEPYGIIYADIDYTGVAVIHGSTRHEKNFFINLKILKLFIKYLFNDLNVFKLKAELLVYDTSAEFLLRSAGFKKEGILKNEILIKGKPQNMLLLALTKKDFLSHKELSRSEIIKIGKMIKNE